MDKITPLDRNAAISKAADALRRHDQAGKLLNPWSQINSAQKGRWLTKAQIVIDVYEQACAKLVADNLR